MRLSARSLVRLAALGALLGAAAWAAHEGPMPPVEFEAVHGASALHWASSTDPDRFKTSDRCIACHQGVSTSDGTDVSIGYDWRASMMANSARDPYWQAAVRREILDHPDASGAIEAKCSRCHMPMAHEDRAANGATMGVFEHLPIGADIEGDAALAADGVSCAACHQIEPDGLGTEGSYTGGFSVAAEASEDGRPVYGPFEPDAGGATIMHSATTFRPRLGEHVQTSELCATCHTLFTHALRDDGSEGDEFPEQVPYLEWKASAFAGRSSCQDCHMPVVEEAVPVTGVLGRARGDVSRHVFRGGNFFMLRMLARYRDELGVQALPRELSIAASRTEDHLRSSTARLSLDSPIVLGSQLHVAIDVANLAGHKFPTAYPSRRAWLHVTIADGDGIVVFESGAFQPDGSIVGNDNDEDPTTFEPHYSQITAADQVQVWEAVMVDGADRVTTGLMSAERWIKDNRLLPEGFDGSGPDASRVAVRGAATEDGDFRAGGDRVRYSIEVDPTAGPFTVTAELWFQPIAYRWAENLAGYDAVETRRFVDYYRVMSEGSAISIARAAASSSP